MSAAFKENVPLSEEDWRDEWAKAKTHEGGIHEYVGAHSASAFQTDEYLSLKVIWNFNTVNGLVKGPWATFFDTKHGGMKGQRLHLQSFDDEWVHYLGRIPAPGETQMNLFEEPYPKELGRFALALHSQLEVRTPGNRKGGHETSKLIFSRPVTRSQTKPGSRSSSRRPLIHDRDSPGPIQSSSSSSGLEEHSPAGPQERALLPTGDEQVVNAALVNFLNALFLRDNKHSSWTMDRKRFVFQSKKTGVQFTAITDGHLRIENVESSAAIIEVKARHRHAEFGGKIEMQESAQMANWIFQEPNSHWSRDRLDPKHHRLLIAQNRHEIYVVISEYTQKYIDYLHNKVGMESAGFLTMHRFGPFMTYDRDHMEKLSGALKVIVKHIWTFSPGPEPSSTPMPLAAQRAAMRADSPLRGRPRPEADHPHHVQRSSSESSPSPNGGGVSINEDMPIRRKLFPAEGEGHGGRRGRLETSARDAPARPQKSPAPHEQRKDSPRGQSKQGP